MLKDKIAVSASANKFPNVIYLFVHRCEPFPTYPRTYDMLHANGLLSHLSTERCDLMDLFLEMDRILRPEVFLLHFLYLFVIQLLCLNIVLLPTKLFTPIGSCVLQHSGKLSHLLLVPDLSVVLF